MRVVAGFETVELLFISLEKAFGYHEERAFQHQLRCGRREKNSLGVNPLYSPIGSFPERFCISRLEFWAWVCSVGVLLSLRLVTFQVCFDTRPS